MDAGYDCQIPLARVDIFLDEDSGSYSFCELNTDGSAGMVVTDAICQAVRMTPLPLLRNLHPTIPAFGSTTCAVAG